MAAFLYRMKENYLDTLVSSYFKASKEGGRLFYPGLSRRGYIIPSEDDYQRVARQLKKYIIASFVLAIVVGAVGGFLGSIIDSAVGSYLGMIVGSVLGGVLYGIFYKFVLAPSLVRGMEPSDERMSMSSVRERFTSQALTISPVWLWLWEVTALFVFAIGIATLFAEPVDWFSAFFLIAIAVLMVAYATYSLVVRRRANHPKLPYL